MRSSTFPLAFRELLAGVKQWKRELELTSKRLSQIFIVMERVDADGARPLQRGGYKVSMRPVSDKCVSNHKSRVVPRKVNLHPFVSVHS